MLLYYVGSDKVLYERIQVNFGTATKWAQNPDFEYVATTAQPGDFVGMVTGTAFTDLDADAGDKNIKRSEIIWYIYA